MSDKKPMIPQNNENFFIFKKDSWNFSINIFFDHSQEINIINLFFIVKLYTNRPEILLSYIYICAESLAEDKVSVFRSISIKKLQKMQYIDFEFFINELLSNDETYLESYKYYGLKLIFHPLSPFWKEGEIYPIFPWDSSLYKTYFGGFIRNENEIQKLKRQNKLLKWRLKKYSLYSERFNLFWKKKPK